MQNLKQTENSDSLLAQARIREMGSQGGTSIWRVHGGVPRVRVIFSRKISEKGMSIFHKNSGKGNNICKKFQIGSIILMSQMTNQKKTELIDFFDIIWTKNPQFLENFLKMEAIFSSKSYFGDLHKAQKFQKGSNFFFKNSRKGLHRDFIVAQPLPKILWAPPPGNGI